MRPVRACGRAAGRGQHAIGYRICDGCTRVQPPGGLPRHGDGDAHRGTTSLRAAMELWARIELLAVGE